MYVLDRKCHIAWTILYVLSSLILIYEVGVLRKWKHYHERKSDFSQRRTHQDWWTNIHASHAALFRFHLSLERDQRAQSREEHWMRFQRDEII